jgi:hypothetical protein
MRLQKFNEYYQGDLTEIKQILNMLTDEGCDVNIDDIKHRDFTHHLKINGGMDAGEFVIQCKSVREHLKNACSASAFMIINNYKYFNIDEIENPRDFASKNSSDMNSAVCFFKL